LPDAQESAVPQGVGAAAQLAESRPVLMQQRKGSSFMDKPRGPSEPQGSSQEELRRSKRRKTGTEESSKARRTSDAGEGSSGPGQTFELAQRSRDAPREQSRSLTPEARMQERLQQLAACQEAMTKLEPQQQRQAKNLLSVLYREVDVARTTRIGQVLQRLEIRRQELLATPGKSIHRLEISRFQEILQKLDTTLKQGKVVEALDNYQALGEYLKEDSEEARQDLRQAWKDLHEAPLSPDLLIRRDLQKMSASASDGRSRLEQARTTAGAMWQEAVKDGSSQGQEGQERAQRYQEFTMTLGELELGLIMHPIDMDEAQQLYGKLKRIVDAREDQSLREVWQDLHGWSKARKVLDDKGYNFHDPSPEDFPRGCSLEAREGAQPLTGRPSKWDKELDPKHDLAEYKAICEELVGRELKKRGVATIEEALGQPWQLKHQEKPADHKKVLEEVRKYLQTGVQPSDMPKIVVWWPELEKKLDENHVGIAVRREREETGQVTGRGIPQYRDREGTESFHVIMEPIGESERIMERSCGSSILHAGNFNTILRAEARANSVVEKDAEGKEVARWYRVVDEQVRPRYRVEDEQVHPQPIHLALDYRPHGRDQKIAESESSSRMFLWLDKETNTLYLTDQQGRLSTELSKGNQNLLTDISSGSSTASQARKDRFQRYM